MGKPTCVYGNLTGAWFSKSLFLGEDLWLHWLVALRTGMIVEREIERALRLTVIVILKHNILWDEKSLEPVEKRSWLEGDDTARMHVHGNSISKGLFVYAWHEKPFERRKKRRKRWDGSRVPPSSPMG